MLKRVLPILFVFLCLTATAFPQAQPQPSRAYGAGGTVPSTCKAPSLFYKTSTTQGLYHCVAGVYVSLGGGGGGAPIGGSGTADFMPYFTASTTLGNGPIRFTGNHIFIHPGQPTRKVAIGSDIDVIPAAALEINSTTLGFVPPRVTTTQRNAMSPVEGWEVHNSTTHRPNYYNGSAWVDQTSLTADVTGTLPVTNGGTGVASATAYALLAGGTTSTGAFQSLAGVGTSGQVLTSNGAGALPTFQTATTGNKTTIGTIAAYKASPPASPTAGDSYVCTDSPYTYRYNGSTWLAFVYGHQVVEPILADFTQVRVNVTTLSTASGGVVMDMTGTGLGENVQVLAQAIPGSGAYYVDAAYVYQNLTGLGGGGAGVSAGTATSDALAYNWFGKEGVTPFYFQSQLMLNCTTFFSNNGAVGPMTVTSPLLWTRVYDDRATTRSFWVSINGTYWTQVHSENRTNQFTPAQGVIAFNPFSAHIVVHLVHFSIHQ